ncbi:hypothetical protein QW131_30825 [Roseibium salinum]|nr:hypothetical protein [Roseibium salinum]
MLAFLEGLIDAAPSHYPDPDKRKKLVRKQAERVAVSRTVAGVHYPVDSWAGALLGQMIGEIILNKCGVSHILTGLKYEAKAESDFMLACFRDPDWKDHGVSELPELRGR